MDERRAATRVAPIDPIPVKLKSSLPARVLDISAGGVQVEVATSMRPEADCELRVQTPDGEVTLRARVKRCKAWGFGLDESDRRVLLFRAGLQFLDLSADALARLRHHFASREEVYAPPPADLVEEPRTVTAGKPVATPEAELPQAPRRTGPVKIRINAEHVRRILQGGKPS